MAGVFLRLLLRLAKPKNKIKHDTDFLGYEAFSSISLVAFGSLPQVKACKNDKKPAFVESSEDSLPLKAA